ncbi:MAG: hypothetical protein ACXAD7_07350 [Candidatus Kariarchaeaceae archaeon]
MLVAPCLIVSFNHVAYLLKNVRYNARLFASASGMAVIVFMVSILTIYVNLWLFSFILLILIVSGSLLVYDKEDQIANEQNTFTVEKFLKDRSNVPLFLAAIFSGFFMIASYYVPILYFGTDALETDIKRFFLVFIISIYIIYLLIGWLADTIGRKWTILLGFYTQTLIFISLMLNDQDFIDFTPNFVEFFLFPVITALGFVSSSFIIFIYAVEYPKIDDLDIRLGIFLVFFSGGMILSAVLLYSLFDISLTFLSIIVIMLLFIATNNTFQMKETLVKTEQEKVQEYVQSILKNREISLDE